VVPQQVIDGTAPRPHRHAGCSCVIVLLHGTGQSSPLEVTPNIGSGGGSHRRFYSVSIPVIHERRRCCSAHPHQAILSIIAQCIRVPRNISVDLVAIIVIAVGIRAHLCHCMVVVRVISIIHPRLAQKVPRCAVIGVILQGVGPSSSTRGYPARQPIQLIIGEGLRLWTARQVILDRQHVPVRIIRVAQVLQAA